jgi:hypothetical protein
MMRALSLARGITYNDSTETLLDGLCYHKKDSPFARSKYLLKTDLKNYNERTKIAIMDDKNEIHMTLSLLIGHILDSIISADEIVIDNKPIKRSKLRNSFVHGRWYVSENCWELFDGNKNEFDYDWHKSINIIKLKDCVIEHLINIYEKEKNIKKLAKKN